MADDIIITPTWQRDLTGFTIASDSPTPAQQWPRVLDGFLTEDTVSDVLPGSEGSVYSISQAISLYPMTRTCTNMTLDMTSLAGYEGQFKIEVNTSPPGANIFSRDMSVLINPTGFNTGLWMINFLTASWEFKADATAIDGLTTILFDYVSVPSDVTTWDFSIESAQVANDLGHGTIPSEGQDNNYGTKFTGDGDISGGVEGEWLPDASQSGMLFNHPL